MLPTRFQQLHCLIKRAISKPALLDLPYLLLHRQLEIDNSLHNDLKSTHRYKPISLRATDHATLFHY